MRIVKRKIGFQEPHLSPALLQHIDARELRPARRRGAQRDFDHRCRRLRAEALRIFGSGAAKISRALLIAVGGTRSTITRLFSAFAAVP